jgi:hypothetical protein
LKGLPMSRQSILLSRQSFSSISNLPLAFAIALPLILLTGCGGSSTSTPPVGNTVVTVLATSTGNDQLSQFRLTVANLTLTSKSGKTVTVFSTPESAEFVHLNGTVEPLYATEIPQDIYTSATVTIEPAGYPECVGYDPADNDLLINGSVGSYATPLTPTVNLPAPITVAGAGMGLALNLQVSESISSFNCTSVAGSASITPTFNLTPITIAAQPTNGADGKATGLHGSIDTIATNGASFSVTSADGPSWQVTTNASTLFQGISGASQLATGLPVDMDVAIQADSSLLATRVAVYDTNTANLSVMSGPLLQVSPSITALLPLMDQNQGPLFGGLPEGPFNFSFSSAAFQTSGQFANIQSLPFSASFTASNMVGGQAVLWTTHATTVSAYIPATTVTLIPQTIDGTVGAVSTSGSFTIYSVRLAAYDLFPNLAAAPGQPPLLTDPNTVIVYVDTNTQLLNSEPVAVGSLLRFNGLVFNDNGTLRMDCGQISDGVAE